MLLKLLKCCSNVPGCKQRAGHMKAGQRGLLGQECYKWLSYNSDLSVALLSHVFPMFWISFSKEITELSSCMSTVLAWSQAYWPPLVAGPLPSASCLRWHKTDISREYSSFTGVRNCCWSDFLVTGLYVPKDCETGAGTCLFLRPPLVSVITSISRRDHATHALSNPVSWGIVGSFKSRNWLVPTLPLCQQCKCLLPKGYLGRNLSW